MLDKIIKSINGMVEKGLEDGTEKPPVSIVVNYACDVVVIGGTLTTEAASGKPADKEKRSTDGHSD